MSDDVAMSAVRVVKTYPGPTPVEALAGVSIEAMPGELVCLTGRSGSGKSTLLTLLGLLDVPTAGEITIAGASTSSLSGRELVELRRQHLGFIFQSFNLVPELTAVANVEIALRYQRVPRRHWSGLAREALDVVDLSHRWQARVSTLSGGEQQRVAIARALVKNPRVILADEPTGNLDSDTEHTIVTLLQHAAASGAAVVIATHSDVVSRRADRSYRLHDGRVVA